ncbi:MAG: MATE family efflux transporter [Gemella haemolysans]|nr:MATE family efflux transporter [Gemella haemolysans]MDU3831335.1 MATE family efflux transporter [Gemella haemolysans]
MKKTSVNLLEGPILRAMIAFAIPIMIANIFQQLYNTVDIMIVGRFLGEESLAAVGATAAIFELVVGFALGIGNGMGIVIARHYGAGNYEKLKSAVAATFVIGGVLSIVIAVLGNFTLYPLLKLLGTPSNIIDQSYEYSYLIVVFVGVTLAYNLCAGLLRAVGDSRAALYFLIFSAIINTVLDIYFIAYLHMGVRSAGVATIISQGISAVLCFNYIRRKTPFLIPTKKHFTWNKKLYSDLFSQGLAMGLMFSVVSIGTVILQTSINALGPVIISAQTSARRIMMFALLPVGSMSATITTFTSQNFGARQYNRIVEGLRKGALVTIIWSVLICITLFFASPYLNELITGSNDEELIYQASLYLKISSAFYPFLAILLVLRNALQGLGQKMMPLVSSIIEMLGKILFVIFIIPSAGYLGVIFVEPILWVVMAAQLYYAFRKEPVIRSLKKKSE